MEEKVINFNNYSEETQEVEAMETMQVNATSRFNINKDFMKGAAAGAGVMTIIGFGALFAEKAKRKQLFNTTKLALDIIDAVQSGKTTFEVERKFRKAEQLEIANLTMDTPDLVMNEISKQLCNKKVRLSKKEKDAWFDLYNRLSGIIQKTLVNQHNLRTVASNEMPQEI